MSKIGENFEAQRRQAFKDAALNESGESRVDSAVLQAAVVKALESNDFTLRTFKSGSIGAQARVKVTVTNDEGQEFDLTGQVLLTIPETVVKAS
jgi:hypothetical protein